MGITSKFKRAPLSTIIVDRAARQRQDLAIDDGLVDSIKRLGVLNPIIVEEGAALPDGTPQYHLIAGERRLIHSAHAGLRDIPIRLVTELSALEKQIVELDENLRRKDFAWKEEASAIGRIHSLYEQIAEGNGEAWNPTRTSEAIGLKPTMMTIYLRVYNGLDNELVAKATGLREAYNILARRDERAEADAINDIVEGNLEFLAPKPAGPQPLSASGSKSSPATPSAPRILSPEDSILNASFADWAAVYSGPRFNLIHCDFPYGVGVFDGEMAGGGRHESYDDSPDTYWALCGALAKHLDRIMSPSGHMMFWLSADIDIMWKTKDFFRQHAPSLDFLGFPLIWLKSDNTGIVSDPQRRPRHIYEACLFASREDRKIVRTKADAYPAPTNKDYHPSTKPEPMLRHFMEMLVDENTRLLDPTCGSGAALRAAESLGARPENVVGLELDPTHCENARRALRQFRLLRSALK